MVATTQLGPHDFKVGDIVWRGLSLNRPYYGHFLGKIIEISKPNFYNIAVCKVRFFHKPDTDFEYPKHKLISLRYVLHHRTSLQLKLIGLYGKYEDYFLEKR